MSIELAILGDCLDPSGGESSSSTTSWVHSRVVNGFLEKDPRFENSSHRREYWDTRMASTMIRVGLILWLLWRLLRRVLGSRSTLGPGHPTLKVDGALELLEVSFLVVMESANVHPVCYRE